MEGGEYFYMIKTEMYSCDGKAEHSAAIIATWSFKNHSNMLICFAPKTFLIIISVENSYLHIIHLPDLHFTTDYILYNWVCDE